MHIALVYSTLPDKKAAVKLQQELVQLKLAGCVNIFPIDSCFEWGGVFENDQEWVLLAKTLPSFTPKVFEFIENHHPYDTPCILNWKTEANEAYVSWMKSSLLQ